jgi:serpin B
VPSDAVDTSTRMVLVNAIYFKGTWRSKFEKASTRPEAFHAAPKQALQVPMMHQQESVPYSETDDAQVVALPYAHADADHALSMVVVLPKDAQGLDALEAGLSDGSVARFTSALHEQKVVLTLPRWKSTITTPLNAPLQAMGMTTAFSDGADFSGISTDYAMHISAVLHKAFIEVNEEGTEAAAATAVVMMETAAVHEPEQPVRFVADHPFLYFIRDDSTGAVLFMGRVADPTR